MLSFGLWFAFGLPCHYWLIESLLKFDKGECAPYFVFYFWSSMLLLAFWITLDSLLLYDDWCIPCILDSARFLSILFGKLICFWSPMPLSAFWITFGECTPYFVFYFWSSMSLLAFWITLDALLLYDDWCIPCILDSARFLSILFGKLICFWSPMP